MTSLPVSGFGKEPGASALRLGCRRGGAHQSPSGNGLRPPRLRSDAVPAIDRQGSKQIRTSRRVRAGTQAGSAGRRTYAIVVRSRRAHHLPRGDDRWGFRTPVRRPFVAIVTSQRPRLSTGISHFATFPGVPVAFGYPTLPGTAARTAPSARHASACAGDRAEPATGAIHGDEARHWWCSSATRRGPPQRARSPRRASALSRRAG